MDATLYHHTCEILGHLWSVNDTIAWWLRLTSNSDRPHPYKTCTRCLRYWHTVSRAYRCTLIPFHRPSRPRILEFLVTCGVEMMQLHHGWGSHPPQTAFHIHTRHIQSVWAVGMLSHRHMGSTLYYYTGQFGPRFCIFLHLWSENDAITSWLRLISTLDCFPHPY